MTKENVNKLNASEAAYIEIIGSLIKPCGTTRITDIAKALNISAPSATEMLKKLCARGFAHHIPYKKVTLTQKGYILAAQVNLQQTILQHFFVLLGVDEATAKKDAVKTHYALHGSTMELFSKFIELIDNSSQGQSCMNCFRELHKR